MTVTDAGSGDIIATESRNAGARERRPFALHCELCRREMGAQETVYLAQLEQYHPAVGVCEGCLHHARAALHGWAAPKPCVWCSQPVARRVVQRDDGRYWKTLDEAFHRYCNWWCNHQFRIDRRRKERARARQGKICTVCGETFDGTRRDAVTCSPKCRQKAHRHRQAMQKAQRAADAALMAQYEAALNG